MIKLDVSNDIQPSEKKGLNDDKGQFRSEKKLSIIVPICASHSPIMLS